MRLLLVGTAILMRAIFWGAEMRNPKDHGSGVILSEQVPGSEILFLVIRVVLKVLGYRYF
jgi:hypothetical protein